MPVCDYCTLSIEGINPDQDHQTLLCDPCSTLQAKSPSIRMTPLEDDDLELVMAWRSNPEVYRYFRHQEGPLVWDEHLTWFSAREDDRHDFIIHFDGRRVGGVSIDSDDFVGVYLGDFDARGSGVATAALTWLCDRFDTRTPLTAEIHSDNEASKRLFERCGFTHSSEGEENEDDWMYYIYDD